MPIVTVVIPLYNKEKYLKRAINSILSQTLSDFELIIVNDGSTDNSRQKAKSFIDDRIKIIDQENKGPGYARNVGIREARSDLVAFLDADDEWLANYLQTGVDILKKNSSCMSITQGYYENSIENNRVNSYYIKKGLREGIVKIQPGIDANLFTHMRGFINPCNTLFRKTTLIQYGGFFDEYKCLFGEDTFLKLKIMLNEIMYFHLQSNVIIHKKASQLSSNLGIRKKEIPPYLIFPEEIFSFCPPNLQSTLKKELCIRALESARHYAIRGDGRTSKDLLRNYHIPGFKDLKWYRGMLFAYTAPVLSLIFQIYLWSKQLLLKT